jgi:type IV secretion system protein VirD4
MRRRPPEAMAWPLGRSRQPRRIDLWVPCDRTTGVIGPQGSGKTLDLLAHAELAAPGGLLQTSTKADDVLLTLSRQ